MTATPQALAPKTLLIPADFLRIGDKITGQVKAYADDGTALLKTLKRPVEVKTLAACKGQWRTHVHVNGYGCYDGRREVQVSRG